MSRDYRDDRVAAEERLARLEDRADERAAERAAAEIARLEANQSALDQPLPAETAAYTVVRFVAASVALSSLRIATRAHIGTTASPVFSIFACALAVLVGTFLVRGGWKAWRKRQLHARIERIVQARRVRVAPDELGAVHARIDELEAEEAGEGATSRRLG